MLLPVAALFYLLNVYVLMEGLQIAEKKGALKIINVVSSIASPVA